MVRNEFSEAFREITMLNFGIVFLTHSTEKSSEMTDEDGNQLRVMAPDLPSSAYKIINALVDLIGYVSVSFDKEGNSKRLLYTRQTPTVFAGSRYQYLENPIPFSYNSLVNAIGDAIDKQVELDGAETTDHTFIENTFVAERSFEETMEEAKSLWKTLIDKDTTNITKMNAAIERAFGKEIKLSQATEKQQDLVELVIDEFKNLLN